MANNCHGSDQVAAWLPKAATVNNFSSSALQALYFVRSSAITIIINIIKIKFIINIKYFEVDNKINYKNIEEIKINIWVIIK
jgi:hypothetical protein